jgi:hypothetical protein
MVKTRKHKSKNYFNTLSNIYNELMFRTIDGLEKGISYLFQDNPNLKGSPGDTLIVFDQYFFDMEKRQEEEGIRNVKELAKWIAEFPLVKTVFIYIGTRQKFGSIKPLSAYHNDENRTAEEKRRGDIDKLVRTVKAIKVFNNVMRRAGKALHVIFYQSSIVSSKIHGRYWLSGNNGFLMDSSFNAILSQPKPTNPQFCLIEFLDKSNEINLMLNQGKSDFDIVQEHIDEAIVRCNLDYADPIVISNNDSILVPSFGEIVFSN